MKSDPSEIYGLLKGKMAFQVVFFFMSETNEKKYNEKGHLALKKATISREYDVHSCIFQIHSRVFLLM